MVLERERHPVHASVGLVLTSSMREGFGDLVLVTQKDNGKLGLIAGKVDAMEDGITAVFREAWEEANLDSSQIDIDTTPEIKWKTAQSHTSIGVVYHGRLRGQLPDAGYVPDSDEISLVKPYRVDDLLQLVHNRELWYRPEHNLAAARQWLRDFVEYKYGSFEGEKFAKSIIRSWGIEESDLG